MIDITGKNALTYIFTLIKQYVTGVAAKKVDKVDGKSLSTNDLTNVLKGNYDKAYTHATSTHANVNAQVNVIETVKVNGSALTPTLKAVDVKVPTKTSQLTNDSGFLTSVPAEYVTDSELNAKGFLTSVPSEYVTETELNGKGYQTSAQVNSAITSKGYQTSAQVQSAINNAVKGITGVEFSVVSALPQTGVKGTIYLVSNGGTSNNIYDEYIWVTNKFEKIGTTAVDLSSYTKRSEFVEITNQDIDSIWNGVA